MALCLPAPVLWRLRPSQLHAHSHFESCVQLLRGEAIFLTLLVAQACAFVKDGDHHGEVFNLRCNLFQAREFTSFPAEDPLDVFAQVLMARHKNNNIVHGAQVEERVTAF